MKATRKPATEKYRLVIDRGELTAFIWGLEAVLDELYVCKGAPAESRSQRLLVQLKELRG